MRMNPFHLAEWVGEQIKHNFSEVFDYTTKHRKAIEALNAEEIRFFRLRTGFFVRFFQ